MSGCTGKCCAVFNFPATPTQLRKRGTAEADFLADMLVGLTPDEAVARADKFDVSPPDGFDLREWADAAPSYTCRHWDESTKLCTVYEDRPRMCRDYPYAGRCQHDCECGFTLPTHRRTEYAARNVEIVVKSAA